MRLQLPSLTGNMQAGGQAAEGPLGTRNRHSGSLHYLGAEGCTAGAQTASAKPSQATFWKQICLAHSMQSPEGFLSSLLSPLSPLRPGTALRTFIQSRPRRQPRSGSITKPVPTEASPRDPQLATHHGKL